jgi:hypothetical protein
VGKLVSVKDLENPYLGDCKTVYTSSILVVASSLALINEQTG